VRASLLRAPGVPAIVNRSRYRIDTPPTHVPLTVIAFGPFSSSVASAAATDVNAPGGGAPVQSTVANSVECGVAMTRRRSTHAKRLMNDLQMDRGPFQDGAAAERQGAFVVSGR